MTDPSAPEPGAARPAPAPGLSTPEERVRLLTPHFIATLEAVRITLQAVSEQATAALDDDITVEQYHQRWLATDLILRQVFDKLLYEAERFLGAVERLGKRQ
jgi:hypothetical protein